MCRGWCLGAAALVLSCGAVRVSAQNAGDGFHSTYVVAVKDTAAHLLHVTATFSGVHQPALDLQLPVWTPGWYAIENYGRNVERFTVTDGAGRPLPAHLVHVQTWRVDTRGVDAVVAQFDYVANELAVNQAQLADSYLFFTGTQLFLEPLGHREAPSWVRLMVPAGWRIVSALDDTPDSSVFRADNYDDLVDAPVEAGAMDVVPLEVEGKPIYLVFNPSGLLPPDSVRGFRKRLARVIRVESAIFGGLPFDKYLIFYLDRPSDSKAQGSLEHHNSIVSCCGDRSPFPSDWQVVSAAHEFFHLWNVKRIRPAEMWPYDYSRPNETPSLWVSEGVTVYYQALVSYRAGMDPQDLSRRVPCQLDCPGADTSFLDVLGQYIGAIEANEAHQYISPSDASVSTWLDYDDPRPFAISYYTTGAVLGALLDLSIHHDTHAARGLDDVMRALYRNYYLRGRGFTPEDLVHTVSTVAGRDYTDFFRRYVTGTDLPPYDTIFGYAGLRVTRAEEDSVGRAEFHAQLTARGAAVLGVIPTGPAARAGLEAGDTIVAADGAPIGPLAAQVSRHTGWPGWGGRRVVLTVVRGGRQREVPVVFDAFTIVSYRIRPDPNATADQLAVRSAWLARTP